MNTKELDNLYPKHRNTSEMATRKGNFWSTCEVRALSPAFVHWVIAGTDSTEYRTIQIDP